MPNTNYILDKIRVEGEFKNLIAKSNGENVAVAWKGADTTLAAALADIFTSITELPTSVGVDSKISAAIDGLIGGAPKTYDTLKEIADYIESHESVSNALNAAIGNKVDKADGMGLSAENFTTALKTKLENLPETIVNASAEADGLMSKEDKARLDGIRGVRYGTEPPADMKDGEMFVRVVSE